MKKIIFFLLALAAYNSPAQSIKQLKRDMYGIASDATEGRFTGSRGFLKAARYVAGRLKAAGLKTFFQPVPFIRDSYDGSGLAIDGVAFPHAGGNFIVLQHSVQPTGEWVVLQRAPDSAATAALLQQKVAGVILLPNEEQAKDWETTVIRQYRFGYMHYAAGYSPTPASLTFILVSPALAGKLTTGKLSVNLKYRQQRINGYNVIATLAGTDKALQHQTIITGAHLDHIGRLGNHIYNGANDDGSGCAAVLTAAKLIAAHPTRRPLMFVFYCGEELNLLGSRYFMDHPPVPVRNIRMNINLEQVGSRHRQFRGIWAIGDEQFKDEFFRSGKIAAGTELKFTPIDSLRDELSNTDSYSFMKKNVPSILLGSGGFDEHHRTEDKIDLIDFEHLQQASRILRTFILRLGNE